MEKLEGGGGESDSMEISRTSGAEGGGEGVVCSNTLVNKFYEFVKLFKY